MLQLASPHSSLAQIAYRALLASLAAERDSLLRGTAICKVRDRSRFWYDSYRIGNTVKTRYLGPDSPQLREILQTHNLELQNFATRKQERRSFVRFLKAEGLASVDCGIGSFLSAFAMAGGFQHGAVLIGEHAFRLQANELGCQLGAVRAIPGWRHGLSQVALAAPEPVSPMLDEITETLLSPATFPSDPLWPKRWSHGARDVRVACLSPAIWSDESVPFMEMTNSRMSSRLLAFLLEDAIPAALAYRSGVLVRIPRPERLALYQLLRSQHNAAAGRLDRATNELERAAALLAVLVKRRPEDLHAAWVIAKRHFAHELKVCFRYAPHINDLLRSAELTLGIRSSGPDSC